MRTAFAVTEATFAVFGALCAAGISAVTVTALWIAHREHKDRAEKHRRLHGPPLTLEEYRASEALLQTLEGDA